MVYVSESHAKALFPTSDLPSLWQFDSENRKRLVILQKNDLAISARNSQKLFGWK